jgi:hypothetical protein
VYRCVLPNKLPIGLSRSTTRLAGDEVVSQQVI